VRGLLRAGCADAGSAGASFVHRRSPSGAWRRVSASASLSLDLPLRRPWFAHHFLFAHALSIHLLSRSHPETPPLSFLAPLCLVKSYPQCGAIIVYSVAPTWRPAGSRPAPLSGRAAHPCCRQARPAHAADRRRRRWAVSVDRRPLRESESATFGTCLMNRGPPLWWAGPGIPAVDRRVPLTRPTAVVACRPPLRTGGHSTLFGLPLWTGGPGVNRSRPPSGRAGWATAHPSVRQDRAFLFMFCCLRAAYLEENSGTALTP